MKGLRYILVLLVAFGSLYVTAQIHSVQAKIDSTTLLIGQQTKINFELVQHPDTKVQFPVFSDSIVDGLEIVNRSKLDTTKLEDGNIKINSSITVTSFDSALYFIPPFYFVSGIDTFSTNPLSLKVLPVNVDTTTAKIYDIKPIYSAPIDWGYVAIVTLIILLIIGLGVLAFFYIRKRKRKQPKELIEKKIVVNPYEEALSALEKIRQDKIWQQGRIKDFYTELTTVLREYIELRFHIPALEMTSDEIMDRIKFEKIIDKKEGEILLQVLKLADLVKFAKWTPEFRENDLSLENAFLFVKNTKPQEEQIVEEESVLSNDTNVDIV